MLRRIGCILVWIGCLIPIIVLVLFAEFDSIVIVPIIQLIVFGFFAIMCFRKDSQSIGWGLGVIILISLQWILVGIIVYQIVLFYCGGILMMFKRKQQHVQKEERNRSENSNNRLLIRNEVSLNPEPYWYKSAPHSTVSEIEELEKNMIRKMLLGDITIEEKDKRVEYLESKKKEIIVHSSDVTTCDLAVEKSDEENREPSTINYYDLEYYSSDCNDVDCFERKTAATKTDSNTAFESKEDLYTELKNPLLTRAYFFLEDGNNEKAITYINRVLDQDPQNSMAYLANVMASIRTSKAGITISDLFSIPEEELMKNNDYKRAKRYANEEFNNFYLERRVEFDKLQKEKRIAFEKEQEEKRNEEKRKWLRFKQEYEAKIEGSSESVLMNLFTELHKLVINKQNNPEKEDWDYEYLEKKCEEKIELLESEKQYFDAELAFKQNRYIDAYSIYKMLGDYKDSKTKMDDCNRMISLNDIEEKYNKGVDAFKTKQFHEALNYFLSIQGEWKDSNEMIEKCRNAIMAKEKIGNTMFLVVLAVSVLSIAVLLLVAFF